VQILSNIVQKIKTSLDERFKFSALEYSIPNTANSFGYVLGSLTIIAFSILGVTGIILALFYVPNPQQASQSVSAISRDLILAILEVFIGILPKLCLF